MINKFYNFLKKEWQGIVLVIGVILGGLIGIGFLFDSLIGFLIALTLLGIIDFIKRRKIKNMDGVMIDE